jgi:predicted acetyltransferase
MDTVIEEAPYLSYDALRSMFAFLSTYSGNSRSAVLTAPLTMRPELFFTEPNDISSRTTFDGMARIVDAVAALETLNMHEGETITIEITDEFLPWNDGVFRVTSHEGKTLAARSDSPADLSCGVGALTQLVSGFASLDESAALGKAEILSNSVLLREVFSKKDLFIANYF